MTWPAAPTWSCSLPSAPQSNHWRDKRKEEEEEEKKRKEKKRGKRKEKKRSSSRSCVGFICNTTTKTNEQKKKKTSGRRKKLRAIQMQRLALRIHVIGSRRRTRQGRKRHKTKAAWKEKGRRQKKKKKKKKSSVPTMSQQRTALARASGAWQRGRSSYPLSNSNMIPLRHAQTQHYSHFFTPFFSITSFASSPPRPVYCAACSGPGSRLARGPANQAVPACMPHRRRLPWATP